MKKEKTIKKGREEFFKYLMEITYPVVEVKENDTRPKFEINGNFGCYTDSVVKLVSNIFAALNQDIEVFSRGVGGIPRIGTIIVPLNSDNGHDYTLNEPCMVTSIDMDDSNCMGVDGEEQNTMSLDDPDSFRLAEEEEIIYFVNHFEGEVVVPVEVKTFSF